MLLRQLEDIGCKSYFVAGSWRRPPLIIHTQGLASRLVVADVVLAHCLELLLTWSGLKGRSLRTTLKVNADLAIDQAWYEGRGPELCLLEEHQRPGNDLEEPNVSTGKAPIFEDFPCTAQHRC